MNKSIDMTNLKKDQFEVCTECNSNKTYDITDTRSKCFSCGKEFQSQKTQATQKTSTTKSVENSPTFKLTDHNVERKTYSLRREKCKIVNLKSKADTKQEPEIIELLSSEDEDSKTTNSNSPNADNQKKTNEKTNDTKTQTQNGAKYMFREWDIKESDVESFDKLTNGKYIHTKPVEHDKIIEKKVKNFRLGNFIVPAASTLQLSPEGIEFKLTIRDDEGEYFLVSITVCIQDIVYCAFVFHYPVYVLLVRIHDTTSNLYYNQLKELKSFQTSHIDQTHRSRIAAVLDLSRSEVHETCFQFESYFKQIQSSSGWSFNSNFIKLPKSKQLIYNVFRNDKNLDEIVSFTKECLADDLAKPLLKYPNGDDAVVINYGDLSCLDDGVFLNDNIISFYLKYLQYEVLTEQERKRTHIFDTFFYQCLTTKSQKKLKDDTHLTAAERRHARVKNWTRNVNLFEKDFLIVPINKNSHWYLVIICYPYLSEPVYDEASEKMEKSDADTNDMKYEDSNDSHSTTKSIHKAEKTATSDSTTTRLLIDSDISNDEADEEDSNFSTIFSNNKENNKICIKMPIILVFDSLLTVKKTRVIATLREYLQCEWNAKYGDDSTKMSFLEKLPGAAVRVPIQNNYFDCGIFLLQYVEQFFKDPITDFTLPIKLDKWFTADIINKKREQIKDIIIKKSKEKPRAMVKSEPIKPEDNTTTTPTTITTSTRLTASAVKQNGCMKNSISNGNHSEDTQIKRLKHESHLKSDSPKSPVINSPRSFYSRKDHQDSSSKSKHILDDMDNLI